MYLLREETYPELQKPIIQIVSIGFIQWHCKVHGKDGIPVEHLAKHNIKWNEHITAVFLSACCLLFTDHFFPAGTYGSGVPSLIGGSFIRVFWWASIRFMMAGITQKPSAPP